MAWYDYGIKSYDGLNNLPTSNGVSLTPTQWLVATGCRTVGTITVIGSETHSFITLCTTKGGTQIQFEIKPFLNENVSLYHPNDTGNVWGFFVQPIIRKSGSQITSTAWGGNLPGGLLSGGNDIYEYWYRTIAGDITDEYNASRAYPLSKHGNTHTIICAVDSSGMKFYSLGYSGVQTVSEEQINNPVHLFAHIPASVLDNPDWFNPAEDGLTAEERDTSNSSEIINDSRDVIYDYPGEDIGFASLPSNGVMGLGYYKIFNPTNAQLTQAFDYLWTTSWSEWYEALIRAVYKPENYIVSLMLTACPVSSSGSSRIYFGNLDTNTNSAVVTSQYVTVDCGSITVPLKYGSVLDYSPYQQAQLFIPFVGYRQINVDQIAGGTISIKYNVDLFTGSAVAQVVISNIGSNKSALYNYDCNVSIQVPISSNNYSQLFTSLFSMGATTAVSAGSVGGFMESIAKGIPSSLASASSAQRVEQSGHLASNTGILGHEKPFLILQQVNQSKPQGYESFNGYPSNITSSLSSLSGFTVVESIHLHIDGATDEELNEIYRMLKEGVIL